MPPPADPDMQLMLRVQKGDQEAFSLLLERNHRRVLNLAYRYLGNRAEAEDIVQETFMRLYQARERYSPHARFQAYLLRITSNLCLSRLRRKKPVSLTGGDEGAEREPVDARTKAPSHALSETELNERVR